MLKLRCVLWKGLVTCNEKSKGRANFPVSSLEILKKHKNRTFKTALPSYNPDKSKVIATEVAPKKMLLKFLRYLHFINLSHHQGVTQLKCHSKMCDTKLMSQLCIGQTRFLSYPQFLYSLTRSEIQ